MNIREADGAASGPTDTNAAVTRRRTATAAQSGQLPGEARQARFTQAFSHVVAVMMRDLHYRRLPIADLEWLVLPPIMAGQWSLAQGPEPTQATAPDVSGTASRPLAPQAVALWARVSPSVHKRLLEAGNRPTALGTHEWASGQHIWLMAVAGEPRYVPKFLEKLKASEFADVEVNLRMRGEAGEWAAAVLGPEIWEGLAKPKPRA